MIKFARAVNRSAGSGSHRQGSAPLCREAAATMFGTCCSDLKSAMTEVPESFFRVEENGVFYLTVGYVPTENGPGFFDQAVLFCPFCGAGVQTKAGIAAKIAETT